MSCNCSDVDTLMLMKLILPFDWSCRRGEVVLFGGQVIRVVLVLRGSADQGGVEGQVTSVARVR